MSFKVSDKVLVYQDHHDRNPHEATIYAVKARYVVLMDGSKYTHDGREWGNSGAWFHKRIEPATPERLAELVAARKVRGE